MIENAAVQGAYLKKGLKSIRAAAIREVRGRGLMLAIELHPEAGSARRYCEALARHGVLATDAHSHVIRVSPPLVITRAEVDWAVERIAAALTSLPIGGSERPKPKQAQRPNATTRPLGTSS